VAVVDAKKHVPLKTIALTFENARPMGIVAAPDGRFVYVTTGRGGKVVVIDAQANASVAEIEVGPRPWGIAISRDGNTLYTANGPSNDVSIVDLAQRSVVGRVKVGDSPWGVALGH
jgi:YVTN family beta-propeller protein